MGAKIGGTKGGKYAIGQNSDINVTPFVDVMLVLLIIFMVSIPAATTAIKIDLPPSTPAPPDQNQKPTFISIAAGGKFYLVEPSRTQPESFDSLGNDLAGALSGHGDPRQQPVLIRADRDVHYGEFMAVVDQLQEDGYYKVSLITENLS